MRDILQWENCCMHAYVNHVMTNEVNVMKILHGYMYCLTFYASTYTTGPWPTTVLGRQ